MAIYYLRSTDGADTDNGSTWALAKANIDNPSGTNGAIEVATSNGDVIYVSQAHAETSATTCGLTNGVANTYVRVIGVSDAAEPPTTLTSPPTAKISRTGGANVNITGHISFEGIIFEAGNTSNAGAVSFGATGSGSSHIVAKNCYTRILGSNTSASTGIFIGPAVSAAPTAESAVVWKDCQVSFGATAQGIRLRNGTLHWSGGQIESGSTIPTNLFIPVAGSVFDVLVENVDLSAFTGNLVSQSVKARGRVVFRRCKLHASATVAGNDANSEAGVEVWLDNCDSGDTNYRMERYIPKSGKVSHNTSVYKAASDGTTAISWKMEPTSTVSFDRPLYSPEMCVWVDSTGSKTITVECLQNDGTALHIDDAWLEVDYLGTSGYPLGSRIKDDAAAGIDVLDVITGASTTAITTGAGTSAWTGEGGSAISRKFVATITVNEKGWLSARVALAADVDLYVDPVVTVA